VDSPACRAAAALVYDVLVADSVIAYTCILMGLCAGATAVTYCDCGVALCLMQEV
jgi:hypothetical protein